MLLSILKAAELTTQLRAFCFRSFHTFVTLTKHNAISQMDLAHLKRARPDAGIFRFIALPGLLMDDLDIPS